MFDSNEYKSAYRSSLLSFIANMKWFNPIAVTLTLKQRIQHKAIDPIIASNTIRHFLNYLNRSIFGNAAKRFDKSVQIFPVIEFGEDTRFHIHAIIDCPPHILESEFNSKIQMAIEKTDYGYRRSHFQSIRDDGWALYITKFQQKPDYCLSIDWMNVRKN